MQNIFGFIIHPMELGVVWLAVHVSSAGIGIILFTIAVRLVLAPLLITQLRNAKHMQRVQPMVAELKKKHGKDRDALGKATMALYKEHNVNPALGCLPTLLQFPILIGLFYALLHLGQSPSGYPKHITYAKTVCSGFHISNMSGWLSHCYAISGAVGHPSQVFDLFHANFLWLSNGLGSADPLFILPVLAGVTQWIQSRMMLTRSSDPQQQMMNSMMNFMPLMIVFFATRYPSGLSLYWVTSTTIGILIQYRITGLGLLPSTLRSVRDALMRTMSPGGMSSLLATQPARSSRPPSTNNRSTGRPIESKALPPKTEPSIVELNGQDGGSDGADGNNGNASANGDIMAEPGVGEPRAVIRPRKQANRAKGGKRGGRRG